MFRSMADSIPFFRRYVVAVAKGDMEPLQVLERLKLFGVTTRVAQRLFLRQAVHENVEMQNDPDIRPNLKQQLADALREIDKAFDHLTNDDFLCDGDELVLMNWH